MSCDVMIEAVIMTVDNYMVLNYVWFSISLFICVHCPVSMYICVSVYIGSSDSTDGVYVYLCVCVYRRQ